MTDSAGFVAARFSQITEKGGFLKFLNLKTGWRAWLATNHCLKNKVSDRGIHGRRPCAIPSAFSIQLSFTTGEHFAGIGPLDRPFDCAAEGNLQRPTLIFADKSLELD